MASVTSEDWDQTFAVNVRGPFFLTQAIGAPLGRVGEPADVVAAVTFLASGAAAYITGQHLRIDGGWSAR